MQVWLHSSRKTGVVIGLLIWRADGAVLRCQCRMLRTERRASDPWTRRIDTLVCATAKPLAVPALWWEIRPPSSMESSTRPKRTYKRPARLQYIPLAIQLGHAHPRIRMYCPSCNTPPISRNTERRKHVQKTRKVDKRTGGKSVEVGASKEFNSNVFFPQIPSSMVALDEYPHANASHAHHLHISLSQTRP